MAENDPTIEGGIGDVNFSSVDNPLEQGVTDVNQVESSVGVGLGEVSDIIEPQNQSFDLSSSTIIEDVPSEVPGQPLYGVSVSADIGEIDSSKLDLGIQNMEENSSTIDETLFLETGDNSQVKSHSNGGGRFGKYLRLFFFSSILIIFGVVIIVLLYLFDRFITEASKPTVPANEQNFVAGFKDKLKSVKGFFGKDATVNYQTPGVQDDLSSVNKIIDTNDLDYIEKKDILTPYVTELIRDTENKAREIEDLKHDIAKHGFLPDELDGILSKDQAIDTIQRSLNALEVIKFSTATKVYSYMDSALQTISEMVKVNSSSPESIYELFTQLNSRGEKDISSYVYMCYLNPFETRAGCDDIGDLDMYYEDLEKQENLKLKENPNYKKMDMIDIKLFKNAMSAIDQLLEGDQSSLFSITFNGFNAGDKNITFNIEVYTNQNDEKTLMEKGKRNPNIFILTNIVNLLKLSSFVIGAEINMNTVDVEMKTVDFGGFSMQVNYTNQEFTVPIQKDTEREIFDYIDLDNLIEKMSKGSEDSESLSEIEDFDESEIDSNELLDDEDILEGEESEGLDEDNVVETESDEGLEVDNVLVEEEQENSQENAKKKSQSKME